MVVTHFIILLIRCYICLKFIGKQTPKILTKLYLNFVHRFNINKEEGHVSTEAYEGTLRLRVKYE